MEARPAARDPRSGPGHRRRIGTVGAALACSLVAACGSATTASSSNAAAGHTATARPAATPGATASAIETRLLAQQGLAIGLASNVVQSQVTVLEDALMGSTSCSALAAGTGSSKVLQKTTSGQSSTASIDIYYDDSCAHPYIQAAAQLTASDATSTISITEPATYLGPSGTPLGTLQLSESVLFAGTADDIASITVDGTGTFTAQDGAPAVGLGLECAIPASSDQIPPFVCSGAVAQPFPAIGLSLASVAPLTITLTPIPGGGDNDYSVAFAGTQSTSEKGALGALSITTPTPTTFAIGGGGTAMPANATSGNASLFALFSPAPTGWTVTDATDGSVFSLALVSSTQLTGTVTTKAGASLAHITLDQSGSGTITYAGGSTSPITNWTLGG